MKVHGANSCRVKVKSSKRETKCKLLLQINNLKSTVSSTKMLSKLKKIANDRILIGQKNLN